MPRLSEYDYHLPEEFIAQYPLADRASSRLLQLDRQTGAILDRQFTELEQLLQPGDLLVMNNTRVTAKRLFGRRETGGQVEALLLQETEPRTYTCLVKPAKRLRQGTVVDFGEGLIARVIEVLEEGRRSLRFDEVEGFEERLGKVGMVPLPPYIHEALPDSERYQTVFATQGGSAAAPTAALHFTVEMLKRLTDLGVQTAEVTLDVGIDTFRPLQTDDLAEHAMHGERCSISPETAEAISRCEGRIVAVGTTSVRTLETFATGRRTVSTGSVVSRLFIQPGFQFQIIDGLLTNFHMPKTTMLVMLSALAGRDNVMSAYRHALEARYRFLSFGDSMLIV